MFWSHTVQVGCFIETKHTHLCCFFVVVKVVASAPGGVNAGNNEIVAPSLKVYITHLKSTIYVFVLM